MAYASDRLYKEVIRKRMGELASRINVRQMLVQLPCLTLSDREEIEAKRDNIGNYGAVSLLLDNLQRRENWPDQFIAALLACEYSTLANEIGEAYDRIRGINTQRTTTAAPSAPVPSAAVSVSPAAPPPPAPAPAAAVPRPAQSPAEASATVTTATIHNVPHSTPTLLTPSVSEASLPSPTPSLINSLPGPYSSIPTSASTEAPALVSAPGAPVQPPPESAPPAEPPLLMLAPDVMPPSPVSAPKVTPSHGQSPVSSRETPQLGFSGSLTNTALSGPSSVAATTLPDNATSTSPPVNKPAPTSQSSASPEKSKVPVEVVQRSSLAKRPIQETNPPGTVLAQASQNNPTVTQVAERVHTAVSPNCQTQETSQETAQATAGAVAGCLSNFAAQNEENFSKPGVLTEEEPARPRAITNPHRAEEPVDGSFSVSSDDLMISSSTTTVLPQHVSDPTASVQNSMHRAQENSLPEGDSNSCPNQPVEDYYESLQTREHTVQFSEGQSIQNLNGQPPSMVGPRTIGLKPNGETESLVMSVSGEQPSQGISQSIKGNNASKQTSPAADLTSVEPASAYFQESELNASGQINIPRSQQRDESQGILQRFQSNKHLIAAAAIGVTAVFVALRLRY